VGSLVIINTGGANLRCRSGPGGKNAVITKFPDGATVQVIDGPIEADDYTWWKVKFDRGVTGWCVEDGLKSLAELLGKKK